MRLGCENALSMQIGVWAANWQSAANWRLGCKLAFGLQIGVWAANWRWAANLAFGLQIGVWAAIAVLAAKWRSNLFENRTFGLSGAAHRMLP